MIPLEKGISELSLLCLDGKKPLNLNEFLALLDITETEFDSLIYKPMSQKLLDLIYNIENWLLSGADCKKPHNHAMNRVRYDVAKVIDNHLKTGDKHTDERKP